MEAESAQVITFANIKGGVGKTTAVTNVAYMLSHEFNKRVLVVDSDDQGNATKALGVRDLLDSDEKTLWHALSNKLGYRKVAVESPFERISLIPSSKELKGAQLAFGSSARGIKMFKRLLRGVDKDFDYVLIDTKPQINVLLQAALAASDGYVVPSFPESDSYDGFVDLLAECEEIFEEENEKLKCFGVLFTNVKKSPAHQAYIEFIAKHLKKAKIPYFRTFIRHSNSIATGSLHNCPAVALSTSRNIAEDYKSISKLLIQRAGLDSQVRPRFDVLGLNPSMKSEDQRVVVEDVFREVQF